ncbi:cation transporter [Ectothiorhodospiraceae bacterium WFHF3C12]|nr:cation transporter [Ectothiorhodospiraceae bacterium WFHF3C12]
MSSCCSEDQCGGVELARAGQARVLYWVLALNAVMFGVEFTAGWLVRSTALVGDSLDMLGDALIYGVTLFALHRGLLWQARASMFKGVVMLLFGVVVFAEVLNKLAHGLPPLPGWMAVVGALALAVNTVCFALLYRYRDAGVNMRSTWICSRNDLVANSGVLVAAGAVWYLDSMWPDIIVGVGIAILFLNSSRGVLRDAAQAATQARAGA